MFLGAQGALLTGRTSSSERAPRGIAVRRWGCGRKKGRASEPTKLPQEPIDGVPKRSTSTISRSSQWPASPTSSQARSFSTIRADKIYLADDPSHHKIEAGAASAAFHSDSTGVTISNLIIQKFDAPIPFPVQSRAAKTGQWQTTRFG